MDKLRSMASLPLKDRGHIEELHRSKWVMERNHHKESPKTTAVPQDMEPLDNSNHPLGMAHLPTARIPTRTRRMPASDMETSMGHLTLMAQHQLGRMEEVMEGGSIQHPRRLVSALNCGPGFR